MCQVLDSRSYKEIHLSVSLLYTHTNTQRARYSLWLRNKIYIFKLQRKYAINLKTIKIYLAKHDEDRTQIPLSPMYCLLCKCQIMRQRIVFKCF